MKEPQNMGLGSWKRILNRASQEIKDIIDDWLMLAILLVGAFFYVLLFGYLYSSALLYDIPIAVLDQDNTSLSRSLCNDLQVQEKVALAARVDNVEEMERLIQDGRVSGGIVIPSGFTASLSQSEAKPVLAIIDGSNLIVAFNLRKGLLTVLRSYQLDTSLQLLAGKGVVPPEILPVLQSIAFRDEVWYNPSYNYVNYIMFGTVVMALHQIPLMGVCLTVCRERQRGKWKKLLHSEGPCVLMAGKTLPYLVLMMAETGLLFLLAHYGLHMPMNGNVWILLLGAFLFLCAVMGLGLLISSLSQSMVESTGYVVLLGLPLFLISGYSWPLYLMPLPLQYLTLVLPSTWMLQLVRGIAVKGGGIELVAHPLMALALIAVVLLFTVLVLWYREARQKEVDQVKGCQVQNLST